MALNLLQLQTLVTLAETRNFSQTAELLHVTQPAVSQQIRALEASLGGRLVDIVGRRTEITQLGNEVVIRAKALLAEATSFSRDVSELVQAAAGTIRVGATVTIGGYVLPDILAGFRDKHPGITIEVMIQNTGALLPMIRDGRVHLGLVEGNVSDTDFDIEPFMLDELVCIAPPDQRLPAKPIMLSALSNERFVVREEGSGTRAIFEHATHAAGFSPHVELALPSSEGLVRAVEQGMGCSFLSRLVVKDAIAAGRVQEIPLAVPVFARKLWLVRRANRTLLPAAESFYRWIVGARDSIQQLVTSWEVN